MSKLLRVVVPVAAALAGLGFSGPASAATITWTSPATIYAHELNQVACPITGYCLAVGQVVANSSSTEGDVVSSTAPATASSWSSAMLSMEWPAESVTCTPTAALCLAGDNWGDLYIHSSGTSTWTENAGGDPTPAGHNEPSIDSLACPTSSLCVGGDNDGQLIASVTPSSTTSQWSVVDTEASTTVNAVACPSASLCVAVTGNGAALASATPKTNGSWLRSAIDSSQALVGVSCPSTTFCVAVDSAGYVLTSTNPGAATPTWARSPTAVDPHTPTSISCPSSSQCVLVDASGNVFSSANPGGGTSAWAEQAGVDSTRLASVSCTADGSTCVAVDSTGREIVGTVATAKPANGALPTISGKPVVGQVLKLTQGTWSGNTSAPTDQWEDCSSAGTGCTAIAGATASAYTVTSADVGHTIIVAESAGNSAGSTMVQSLPTAVVAQPSAGSGSGGGSGGSNNGSSSQLVARLGAIVVSGTTAAVKLTCVGAAAGSCSVTLALTVTEHVRKGIVFAIAAAKKVAVIRRVVTVGHATATVHVGRPATVRLTLNRTGTRLLARFHHLAGRLTLRQSGHMRARRAVSFSAKPKA